MISRVLADNNIWLNVLKCNDVVSLFDRRDTLSNRFYDTSTLMTQNNWESSLGVLSRKCIRICKNNQLSSNPSIWGLRTCRCGKHQCNKFRFGLREPLAGQLQLSRCSNPCRLPMPRPPFQFVKICSSKCRESYFTDLTGNSLEEGENQRMKLKFYSGDALLTFPSVEDMLWQVIS
jgi:hypothetical protein